MDAKIDYLSFTVLVDPRGAGEPAAMWKIALEALWKYHQVFASWCSTLAGWHEAGARGHYSTSMFNDLTYAVVRFGGTANHLLIELPGTACQNLRDQGVLENVVAEAQQRLTRLDMAIDIPGGVSPQTFVQAGYNERFASYAELVSETGVTEYVGSMKSERFARVYMYAAPHPRAGVLRVEHVLRSGYAKTAATILVDQGALALATACGNSFGWKCSDWRPEFLTDAKVKSTRVDRHEPGRVRWLHHVCIPALAKAAREGLIDLDEVMARLSSLKAGGAPGDRVPV